jgi:FkbM family methyltransferase
MLPRFGAPYIADLQSLVLKGMARLPAQPKQIPLWLPRCELATGGSTVSHLYDEVFCQRLYESPKPLPERPRIIDAGAHLGLASLFFLYRYPGCTLTSIEPNPALAALLKQNLAAWQNAEVREAALSTSEGFSDFHVTSDNPFNVTGGISNREDADRAVTQLRVATLNAAQLLSAPVDLMKLDVEGHEYQLLPLEIFRPDHIKNLVIEFHDLEQRANDYARVLDTLIGRGYRIATTAGVETSRAALLALTDCVVLKLY